jgi:hypothetical protein
MSVIVRDLGWDVLEKWASADRVEVLFKQCMGRARRDYDCQNIESNETDPREPLVLGLVDVERRLGWNRNRAEQRLSLRIDLVLPPRFRLALAYNGAKPLGRCPEFDSNRE